MIILISNLLFLLILMSIDTSLAFLWLVFFYFFFFQAEDGIRDADVTGVQTCALPILMIGAKDLAFPRINLLSWYIYIIGGVVTIYALLAGGVDTGWTFYVPYSTTFSNSYVIATGLGIFINGFSSILTRLNFIVTIHTMRAPGMTWCRQPISLRGHDLFLLELRRRDPFRDKSLQLDCDAL